MRAFLSTDRLQLLGALVGILTCTPRGVLLAVVILLVVACRRAVRHRLATWTPEGPPRTAPVVRPRP